MLIKLTPARQTTFMSANIEAKNFVEKTYFKTSVEIFLPFGCQFHQHSTYSFGARRS